ncbi:hypothetical protein [Streptomyces sp. NBC_01423]|uniref:hypothetical protein n=1 Tax=Streptomyces sp. NBC_01423 TaxID=2903860 RepID=UPI002E2888ED|nr:hypothetical protein [Streptomyces sp. NBC_01423]
MAEPAANVVLRGHVTGRDFELRVTPETGGFRIRVSDARGERRPELCALGPGAGSGHG